MFNVIKAALLLAPIAAVNAESVPDLITDLSNAFSALSSQLASCPSSASCVCPASGSAGSAPVLFSPITVIPAPGQAPVTVTALNQPITTTVTVNAGGNTVYNIGAFSNVYNPLPTVTEVVINVMGNTIINNIVVPTTTLSPMAAPASATVTAAPTASSFSLFLESTGNPALDGLPIIESNGALIAGSSTSTPQTFAIVNGQLVDTAGNVVAVNTGSIYKRSLMSRQAGISGSLRYGANMTTAASLTSTFELVEDILEFIYLEAVFNSYACLISQIYTLGFTNGDIPVGCFGVSLSIDRVAASNMTAPIAPVPTPIFGNSTVNGTSA